MTSQKIFFENKGQKIAAVLHSPEKSSDKLVILVHGFTGSKDDEGSSDSYPLLARLLAENGLNALRVDFRGSGESEGLFEHMTISGEVSDLHIILKEMRKKFRKIAVLGSSLGGCVTILAYEKNMDLMVLWYPAVLPINSQTGRFIIENLEKIRKEGKVYRKSRGDRHFHIGKDLAEEWIVAEPIKNMDSIRCPLLIVTGDEDKSCNVNDIRSGFERVKSEKQIHIVKGADHCWKGSDGKVVKKYKEEAIDVTVDWLLKNMK